MFEFLALGAGVQSSRLLLEAARGERKPFDAAGFADTQDEPDEVYQWLEWLKEEVARSPVPIPIYQGTAGRLSDEALKVRISRLSGNQYLRTLIPAYVAKPDGGRSMMGRRCTSEFKIRVLTKMQRRVAKVPRGCSDTRVGVTIGISIDEWQRIKPNAESWALNQHPLVDERISRTDCEQWLWEKYKRIAPKSACRQCPFHGDDYWARMKATQPVDFTRAVRFDHSLREAARQQTGTARYKGDVFLHSSLRPLDEVDFGTVPDRLQAQIFAEECEGLCGV